MYLCFRKPQWFHGLTWHCVVQKNIPIYGPRCTHLVIPVESQTCHIICVSLKEKATTDFGASPKQNKTPNAKSEIPQFSSITWSLPSTEGKIYFEGWGVIFFVSKGWEGKNNQISKRLRKQNWRLLRHPWHSLSPPDVCMIVSSTLKWNDEFRLILWPSSWQ